jgi:hypothetical protein
MRARQLTAGTPFTGTDQPETKSVTENTVIGSITSTSYAAGTSCGVTFVAPITGRALVLWGAAVDHNTAGRSTLVSFRLGEGAVIGAGNLVQPADDGFAISSVGVNDLAPGGWYPVDGLTPGATYNVQLQHRVTVGGNGTVSRRSVIVQPLT